MALIKERRLAADPWQSLEARPWLQVGEEGLVPDFPDAADLIVPRQLWRLRRDDLLARSGRLGLKLEAGDDVAEIAGELRHFSLIAVNFPKYADGRGYSSARLLRERYGYRGELRAVGAVGRDLLDFMARCGFDAFALREGEEPLEALSAFEDFSASYQRYPRAA